MKKIQKVSDLLPLEYDGLVNTMLAKATADLIVHVVKTVVDTQRIGDVKISVPELRVMLDSILDVINNYIPDDPEKEDNGCDLADC